MRNLVTTKYGATLEDEQNQADQEQRFNACARESLPEECLCRAIRREKEAKKPEDLEKSDPADRGRDP